MKVKRRIVLSPEQVAALEVEQAGKDAQSRVRFASKLANAERLLKLARTREKRAKTLRRRWEKRVRYYLRKMAALMPVEVKS